MPPCSRRRFLELAVTAGASAALAPRGFAQSPLPETCELLIRGGTVIDPSLPLHARRDVAITNGRIVTIAPDLSSTRAAAEVDARNRLVVPGLIDLHMHIGGPDAALGLEIDKLTPFTGVTTGVSAGDVGYPDFEDFETGVLRRLRTRTSAFLHISSLGLTKFPAPEMLNLGDISERECVRLLEQHPERLLGIKVRESSDVVGDNGIEPLRRAVRVAEAAGGAARVMCHIGNAPGELAALLDLLRPGDIVTHCFSGLGNNLVQNGRVVPAARAARERGVWFDVGHGGGSFDFEIAAAAIDQGLGPDSISSDLHQSSIGTPGRPYLPWIMSKFLLLGYSLDEVIAMTTIKPASVIDRTPGLGSLAVNAPADVTILEEVAGECVFWDTRNHSRTGNRYLKPTAVVQAGTLRTWSDELTFPYPS